MRNKKKIGYARVSKLDQDLNLQINLTVPKKFIGAISQVLELKDDELKEGLNQLKDGLSQWRKEVSEQVEETTGQLKEKLSQINKDSLIEKIKLRYSNSDDQVEQLLTVPLEPIRFKSPSL